LWCQAGNLAETFISSAPRQTARRSARTPTSAPPRREPRPTCRRPTGRQADARARMTPRDEFALEAGSAHKRPCCIVKDKVPSRNSHSDFSRRSLRSGDRRMYTYRVAAAHARSLSRAPAAWNSSYGFTSRADNSTPISRPHHICASICAAFLNLLDQTT
jgi:hypothetical protein